MAPPDYRHLPEPIPLEDTVAEVDARPVPDPDAGINRVLDDAIGAGG